MLVTYEEALRIEQENQEHPQPNPQHGNKQIAYSEFIVIHHNLMLMNIPLTEIVAFALIHSICSNCSSHEFTGSNNYLATRLNCSIPYANGILKKLQQRGLIYKIKDTPGGTCTYVLPDNVDDVIRSLKQ